MTTEQNSLFTELTTRSADRGFKVKVITDTGRRFAIEVKALYPGQAVRGYGCIPEGATKPVRGHEIMSAETVEGWVLHLQRA